MPLSRRLLLTGASALALIGTGRVNAQDASALPLDARLGGTVESFRAVFGIPEPPTSELIKDDYYELPGTSGAYIGVVSGRVVDIMLFAPRPEGEEWTDEPHPMNWTIGQAQQIALDFLPRDAVLYQEVDGGPYGFLHEWYSSDALAAEVPTAIYDEEDDTPQYGKCAAVLWYANFIQGPEFSKVVVELNIEEPPE